MASHPSLAESAAPLSLDAIVQRLAELAGDDEPRQFLIGCLSLVEQEALFQRLKTEAERTMNAQPLLSLRFAELLSWAADQAGAPTHRALGSLSRGDAFRVLGRHDDAVRALDDAAADFTRQGDPVGWARSRLGALRSMHHLGRAEEALPVAEQALEILVANQEWSRAGNNAIYLAWVYTDLARYDDALAVYERAEEYYRRLAGDAEIQIGYVKAHRAEILNRRGDFRGALKPHQEARASFARHNQHVLVLQEDQFIAYAYAGQGHYSRALRLYGDVLAAHEASGLDPEVALVALDLASCYLELNRYADALLLAEEAVARSEHCRAPVEVAKARLVCAVARARLGANDTALALLDELVPTFAAAGLTRQVAIATLLRATLYAREGDWPAALQEAERARAFFRERGLPIEQARSELLGARANVALEQPDRAAELARSALAIAATHDIGWLRPEGHHLLGNVARSAGAPDVALAEYDEAIARIEGVQSRLPSEIRERFLEDKLEIYHAAIACSLSQGTSERAFGYLERAKSRALVDYLTGNLEVRTRVQNATSPELVEQLARLREEHAWLYQRVYGFAPAQPAGAELSRDERSQLEGQIHEREKQIARLVERLALRAAEGRPATSDEVMSRFGDLPRLQAGEVLLEYYFDGASGLVFVGAANRLTVVPLRVGPAVIRRRLNRLQTNLEATAQAWARGQPIGAFAGNARGILQDLYRDLIEPVATHLTGQDRIVVVPFGPTHAVPFHALYDGQQYLIERSEVSVWPASSLIGRTSKRHPSQSALVVGYSDGGRLPNVLAEARAVAGLLPGRLYLEEAATRAAVVGAASGCQVVHLATHGEARLDNPAFAHLKLADGQLSAVDVFNLELDGALVTLSACETGRSVVVGGDEVIGLSRGFLYAGASTLVQTLWRVDDRSTAQLMEQFYRGLSAGLPKAAALREAQRAALDQNSGHPYFWAPFQLIGDHGPR